MDNIYLMKVDRLTKSYNKTDLNNTVRVLKNVSFEIKLTEHKIAIIGPSGAGKSTLLHILGLMERPTTGAVYIYGINCFAQDNKFLCNFRKNNIGFIFQSHYLLYDLTVIENILLPVWSNRNIKILLAKKLLNNVGLLHKQDFFPNELSGGEQQRVAIARALIKNPKIIFADEPTSNLDYTTRAEIEYLLFDLCKNITIVLITHNTSHLNRFNKIIKMNAGSII